MPNSKLTKSSLFSLKSGNLLPVVLLLLLFHLILWSTLTGISHSAPDWDNMEEMVWGSSLEWGYYKHPPLPSWVMHGMIALSGHPIWLTFFTGQLSVVLALFFVWKLGCEFSFTPAAQSKQSGYALIAILLTSLIAYFTVRGVMNNHNTMQLWSIAGAIWMFYRATRHQRLADWAWLGMFCGFAMLTKYSALIQFFCFFVYLIWTGKLKQKSTWQGIAIATLIFLLLMAPHVFWLVQQGQHGSGSPLNYAGNSLVKPLERIDQLITVREFVVTNIGRIAPMLIALVLLVFLSRNKSNAPSTKRPTIASQLDSSDRLFLLIIGISPLVFTLLFALIFKVPLTAHWAATFFLPFGFFSWWFLSDTNLLRRTIFVVIILQVISSVGFSIARGPLSQATGRSTRSTYPGLEVSSQLLSIWNRYNSTPLTLIAGDTWIAGNIAMHAKHKIQVLIDGDYSKSPWVKPDANYACGMLIVIERTPDIIKNDSTPPELLKLFKLSSHQGHLTLPWTKQAAGPQVEIDWGVIPAQENCSIAVTK